MKTLSNSVLVTKLKSVNPKDNKEVMVYLYKSLYWKVQNFILNNKGSKDEVKDIFQDGLLAFFKLVKQDRIKEDVKVEAYIFSTCRNLWLKKLQKKKRESPLEVEDLDIPVETVLSPEIFTVDKTALLNHLLKEIGEGCRSILLAFYYEQLSMEEIVQRMKLSSIQIAKNKKYKCLQRLKKIVAASDFYKNNLR